MPPNLRLELPAEPESVGQARRALDGLAETLGCDAEAVRIAVSELVGNAVVHAYSESGTSGTVLVQARRMRGRLIVTVADQGIGMKPRLDSPGLGLGLPLVSRLAGDVRIESDERGAAVSMSFRCPEARRIGLRRPGRIGKELRGELERARDAFGGPRGQSGPGGASSGRPNGDGGGAELGEEAASAAAVPVARLDQ
jgi:serine/threonine-protein kinase RsbW